MLFYEDDAITFMKALLDWYEKDGRHDLPWRASRDPYNILVSELMLQQTQVSRVVPKYLAFLERFPTLQELAKARQADVLSLWQGLGYNSRAVRLLKLAQSVDTLPQTAEELERLPGIGPYTAGAILIFSREVPALSVDVNVERVLKRLFSARNARPTRRQVHELAQRLIAEQESPHEWQSALMDFGSLVCTARNPRCAQCPLRQGCKSAGPRPDERQRSQGRFAGSNRWYRGRIVKMLLAERLREKDVIERLPDEVKAGVALSQLLKEGIVALEKGSLTVP